MTDQDMKDTEGHKFDKEAMAAAEKNVAKEAWSPNAAKQAAKQADEDDTEGHSFKEHAAKEVTSREAVRED